MPLGLKIAWRRLLKEVASLPLAIALMATIAGLSGLGTLIPQNKVGWDAGRQSERTRVIGCECQPGQSEGYVWAAGTWG